MLLLLSLLACSPRGSDIETDTDPAEDTGADGPLTEVGCEERHAPFLAALEEDLAASDAPAVSAAILEDGVVTCRVAMGVTEEGGSVPVTVDTLFQLGSTTKMFTALALLQQVEAGDLTLETTLAEALPYSEFSKDGDWNDQVTMQHLLTHQGAFYDYLDWTAASDDEDLRDWHEDIFFPYLWLMAEPGAFWNYSNPNFSLAGLVAEEVAGSFYADLMRERVFLPLGMDRTWQRRTDAEADGDLALGVGYVLDGSDATYGAVALEDVPDIAHARPAGSSTWSTPTQALQMARFLMEGDEAVLSDSLREAMTERQVLVPGYAEAVGADAALGYGYGILVSPQLKMGDQIYDVPFWSHGGNTLSYTSILDMLPDRGVAVSILSSGYGTDFSGSAATALTTLADLPAPEDAAPFSFDPDRLDRHVGTYEDAHNVGEIVITREDDALFVEMPLLTGMGYDVEPELVPISSDIWLMTLDGSLLDLTFQGDEASDSSSWVINRALVGTRLEDAPSSLLPDAPRPIFGRPSLPLPGPGPLR